MRVLLSAEVGPEAHSACGGGGVLGQERRLTLHCRPWLVTHKGAWSPPPAGFHPLSTLQPTASSESLPVGQFTLLMSSHWLSTAHRETPKPVMGFASPTPNLSSSLGLLGDFSPHPALAILPLVGSNLRLTSLIHPQEAQHICCLQLLLFTVLVPNPAPEPRICSPLSTGNQPQNGFWGRRSR